MASYNRFKHNCYRDALIVPIINCGTSVFAGLVVFAIIGFMAQETGRPIEEVVSQGGLTREEGEGGDEDERPSQLRFEGPSNED